MESCPIVISHILAEFHPERALYNFAYSLLSNELSKSAQTFTVGFVNICFLLTQSTLLFAETSPLTIMATLLRSQSKSRISLDLLLNAKYWCKLLSNKYIPVRPRFDSHVISQNLLKKHESSLIELEKWIGIKQKRYVGNIDDKIKVMLWNWTFGVFNVCRSGNRELDSSTHKKKQVS